MKRVNALNLEPSLPKLSETQQSDHSTWILRRRRTSTESAKIKAEALDGLKSEFKQSLARIQKGESKLTGQKDRKMSEPVMRLPDRAPPGAPASPQGQEAWRSDQRATTHEVGGWSSCHSWEPSWRKSWNDWSHCYWSTGEWNGWECGHWGSTWRTCKYDSEVSWVQDVDALAVGVPSETSVLEQDAYVQLTLEGVLCSNV